MGHEATRTGAPMMLLHLLGWIRAHVPHCEVHLLLLKGGDLEARYAEVVPVTTVWGSTLSNPTRLERLRHWLPPRRRRRRSSGRSAGRRRARRVVRNGRWDLIYVNTIITRPIARALRRVSCPVVLHVHEMKYALESGPPRELLARADRIIVPSESTRTDLLDFDGTLASKVDLFYECIPVATPAPADRDSTGAPAAELGAGEELVCAVGTVDWRKGADLFLQVVARVVAGSPGRPPRFVWIGEPPSGDFARRIRYDIERLGLQDRVQFVGSVADVTPFYRRMDVLALTSREDPCPLVAIEAALHEVPIACFAGSGGVPEVFGEEAAVVAPYSDAAAMADQILALLADPGRRARMGRRGAEIVRKRHDVDVVAPRIWSTVEKLLHPVRESTGSRPGAGGPEGA